MSKASLKAREDPVEETTGPELLLADTKCPGCALGMPAETEQSPSARRVTGELLCDPPLFVVERLTRSTMNLGKTLSHGKCISTVNVTEKVDPRKGRKTAETDKLTEQSR
jgi:hypothetical protein